MIYCTHFRLSYIANITVSQFNEDLSKYCWFEVTLNRFIFQENSILIVNFCLKKLNLKKIKKKNWIRGYCYFFREENDSPLKYYMSKLQVLVCKIPFCCFTDKTRLNEVSSGHWHDQFLWGTQKMLDQQTWCPIKSFISCTSL